MNYDAAVRYLLSLGRELAAPTQAAAAKFDLENITVLSDRLGRPDRAYPSAHIAGTNGKGSTAAFLESILRQAGFRTGLNTSPHLEKINERIRVNGVEIGIADFYAIDANALVNLFQVRRSIQPGTKSRLPQNRFKKRRRRTLAIRSGDMRRRIRPVGPPQAVGKHGDIFKIEFCSRRLSGRSQFPSKRQQVAHRSVVIHFSSGGDRRSWR